MATRKLEVIITGDASSLEKALGRTEAKGKSFAKNLGKAGVAGAVVGLGAAVKIGVDEFMEAQKVTAQTNAVLKSTGGVANVSAKEVAKLSEALMRKSGVDDEAIASGQNMLLTFTNLRNEAGAGNKIFDEATKATLDLSVAMGKDMQSSAVLVGKALNDPIKGIGALSRVGVQLDDDQKKLIKTMVAAGDTMGAQKIILGELETQFGGSAEAAGKTFGGQINIAKESLSNLAGEGVAKALPKLTSLANWFTDEAVPKIRQLVNYLNETFTPVIKGLVGVFRDALSAIGRLLTDNKAEITTIINGVKTVLQGISVVFEEVIFPALKFYFKDGGPFDLIFGAAIKIVSGVITVIGKIVGAVRDAVVGVRTFWNGDGGKAFRLVFDAMAMALNPVVTAFETVVSSVKWLIDNVGRLKIPDLPNLNPFGDARNPRMTHPGSVAAVTGGNATINPALWDQLASAQAHGLSLTSGYRPGAITANGTPSDHGIFPSKAIDVSNGVNTPEMAAFFMSLIGNPGVKQAFYDPLGSIFGGRLSSYREGGHSNHVHVATYDQGGVLRPGLTLAYNGTGRNEYVSNGGGGGDIVIQVDGETLWRVAKKYALRDMGRNVTTGIA